MPLARRWLRSFCIAGALLRCEVCIVCIMHLDISICNSAFYNNSTGYEKVFTLILPLTLIAVWVGIQKWSGKGRYRSSYGFFCLVVLLWRPDGGGRKARQCFICIPLVGGLSPLRERIECHSNVADDSVIANAVAPKTNKRPSQHFTYAPWVSPRRNAFFHIVNNTPCRLFIKLLKLTLGCFGVINCPSQGLFSH